MGQEAADLPNQALLAELASARATTGHERLPMDWVFSNEMLAVAFPAQP